MNRLTDTIKKKRRNMVKDVGGKILWSLERLVERYSRVPLTPILDREQFEWTGLLEANWRSIRHEMDVVLRHKEAIPSFQDISEDQKSISKDDDWKTYFLYGFGYKAEGNCSRCPETARLVEQIPGMLTALFSILNPGKHIPEHRGVYKGILRYHLGLKVPEPADLCRMRVADTEVNWKEGRGILFDDTYRHEVWNDTQGVRVVLLIDVVRPMRFPGSLINSTLISLIRRTGYVQDARKNQEAWERRYRTVAERQDSRL